MTASATTIQTSVPRPRQASPSEESAPLQNAGALFALSGVNTGALFAEMLSAAGGAAKPSGGGDHETSDPVAQEDASNKAKETKAGDETAADAKEASAEDGVAESGTAAAGADLPMTIHSLNNLLLRGNSAKSDAAASSSRGGAESKSSRGGGANGDGAEIAAPATNDERASAGSTTSTEKAKEPAPSPLAALAKAGETAQTAVQSSRNAAENGQTASTNGAARDGAQAVGALTKIAVAAPAATAGLRDSRPRVTGGSPTAVGEVNNAHATRVGARNLRSIDAPLSKANVQARADAFQAQIARGLAAAVENGRGTLTLRVKPEAIGQVHIKVSMKDGVLNARFEAQTSEARDLLLSTTGDLRRSLEAAGLNVERIEASVSPELREQLLGQQVGDGTLADASSDGRGGGSPGRNDSGSHSGRRGMDAASADHTDGAAEPLAEEADWAVLGLDTIA